MHRDLVLIAFVVLFINIRYVDAKVCPSLDIRNSAKSLEKLRNCTIIMGNLHFVLMDSVNDSSVYEQYSFPELVEIVDYMMVFRISELVSFGKLFPNLRVIRGRKLFLGYALVIYRVPKLQEIGLTNLEHIGRGAIKIDSCPNVCYVRTIDWQSLGASMLDFPSTEASDCRDEFCPHDCAGHCWNNYHCQKRTTNYCPHFADEGKCVPECPKSKIINYDIMACMSEEECKSMLNGTWWIFNGTCISECPIFYEHDEKAEGGCRYVGENYYKHCQGGVVDSLYALEDLNGCTHITTYLEIRISQYNLERFLDKYLGNIVSINDYLKIGRSAGITSLEFLRSLTIIKGENLDNNKYSLFVYENENLRKLWNFDQDFKLTIPTGTMAFHDNPLLCLSEIEKLEKTKGISSKVDMQISKYSNGYKSICNQKGMNITLVEKNPTDVTLEWGKVTINNEDDVVIGYTVYYIETSETVSMYDNTDACNSIGWIGIFVMENRIKLKGLKAYHRYAYYIKTYATIHQGEQTPIDYFFTESAAPGEPQDLKAEAASDSTIVLTWKPPHLNNGNLTQYHISIGRYNDLLASVQQRNYCTHPYMLDIEELVTTVNASVNATANNCTCPERTFFDLFSDEEEEEEEQCSAKNPKFENCVKTLYQPSFFSLFNDTDKYETDVNKNEPDFNLTDGQTFSTPADSDLKSYKFKNLKHFSLYVFYVTACNSKDNGDFECGISKMISQRTEGRADADSIKNIYVRIDDSNAYVEWFEPEDSNSLLVAYQVEYRRTDSEHSKPRFECITHDKYLHMDRVFRILNLTPGTYSVRVQAISLAGPGSFTDWKYFEIIAAATSIFAIIFPILTFVMCGCAIVGVYFWYRRNRARTERLITSINPDYQGPVYVEDEWEVDRKDVVLMGEIGQGSFGLVYEGKIKSRNLSVAVKTANDKAKRAAFLGEGVVMKTFTEAPYVVKLVGIVSRGSFPYVIMELMGRGDLKSFLRRIRDSSQNITTNEMYRMAAQIADGMAYLTLKKYVHRDLAARNCMVSDDLTVKVGDFGMTRDIYETDYYRKDTVGLLPVRWMAPESLADGVFTSDSDVWSYGVVLWEMATLAEQPYQGLHNEQVFRFVKSGGKLERPSECSDLLYEIMDACWAWRPIDRPTFSAIVHKLAQHVGEDFRLIAFVFSKQGKEMAMNAGPRIVNPPALMYPAEDEYACHFDPHQEEVSLYIRERDRPNYYSSQREPSPGPITPGSPSPGTSTFTYDFS